MNDNQSNNMDNIWQAEYNSNVRIGITTAARKLLGHTVFVNLPEVGSTLVKGETLGDIEGVKTVIELVSPVNGTVVAVNDEAVNNPDLVDANPAECWLIEAEVTDAG